MLWNYFIGDIHGCYDEMRFLEDRIADHAVHHGVAALFISVGDLVDRGPASADVIHHFMSGVADGTHVALLGNHEEQFLQVLEAFVPQAFVDAGVSLPPWVEPLRQIHRRSRLRLFLTYNEFREHARTTWFGHGGLATIRSFGLDPEEPSKWRFDPAVIRFLCELPLVWQNQRFVATHALATRESLDAARAKQVLQLGDSEKTRSASVLWRRRLPEVAPDQSRIHVSGHTCLPDVVRVEELRTVQIDTGCVFGGHLAAWCGDADTVLMVSSRARAAA